MAVDSVGTARAISDSGGSHGPSVETRVIAVFDSHWGDRISTVRAETRKHSDAVFGRKYFPNRRTDSALFHLEWYFVILGDFARLGYSPHAGVRSEEHTSELQSLV